ncbi:UNVERIFIED_CONTAM: hypothetical protein H355_012589 [Colinus virginianus]|nr:hypothetical protein H355_012589 [Colinus virginianus]
MEGKPMLSDCPEEKNHTASRKETAEDLKMAICISGDLKAFWTQLESRRVDIIFQKVQEVLLLLKEKIKNGTATNQAQIALRICFCFYIECWQAWALVNEADLGDLLTLTNVNEVLHEESIQETKPKLQHVVTDDSTANSVEGSDSYFQPGSLSFQSYSCSGVKLIIATLLPCVLFHLDRIYECSVSCRCDKIMCQNRVVQHGIQVRLQVFNTEKKGWGVRCLDDIDKGTFVCTYSGRLMSKAEVQELGGADQDLEESAVNDRGHRFFSKKRKLDTSCSDSEIELVQTGKDDILEKQESSSEAVDNDSESTPVHPRNLSTAAVRRLGTRIAVVDNHQLKMEVDTLVHSASSDEDDSCQPHQSRKTELTSGTNKEKERSIQKQKEEGLVEAGQTESAEMDSADCRRKSLPLKGAACGMLNDKCVVKPPIKVPQNATCEEEDHRWPKQGIFCMEADSDRTLLKNANDDNIYILDATKEGNVGRFLNVSKSLHVFFYLP